ncbi:hypothetical protein SAMN02745117_00864 [Lampropedia hyalina DSM 16112]|jgi:hypothetical protein|uniref:Uncharacterized protein n=1 Tax=Lampropedia hyalina DSM 16112 TaxID=1122156 RepID=A0A1M4WHL7_9BURK|nr:hypothetical protein [Lampropedia hyalina]SHE80726.1 hypothetical protein SAMN02745117_00864 [Lampropedia hyalina DSM 16112]
MRKIKTIKFNLPINGKRVRNLEELRQNMTLEILGLHNNGQLSRWLKSRNLLDYNKKIDAIQPITEADHLLEICDIFSIEMKPSTAQTIINSLKDTSKNTISSHNSQEIKNKLYPSKIKIKTHLENLLSTCNDISNEEIVRAKIEASDLFYEIYSSINSEINKINKNQIFGNPLSNRHSYIQSTKNLDEIISKNITKTPGIEKYKIPTDFIPPSLRGYFGGL